MKIGIDIRSAGGEKAGKGWFTFHITRKLLKIDSLNEYFLYANNGIAGFEEFKNAKVEIMKGNGYLWHRKVAKDALKKELDLFLAPSSFIIPAILPKDSKKHKIKSILVVHDLVSFLFPGSHEGKAVLIEKLFLKKALKKSSKIITISENTKKDLMGRFGIKENDILIIPCAASPDFYPIERDKTNLEKLKEFKIATALPDKFFLSVGTIQPRKNYETLLQSFAMIHEKHPAYHLIIVGSFGWGADNLQEIINANYLQKYVHFLGYITNKNLNILYNLAEAFVFPSYYEGFGIPPLEALHASCPVISSNTSSMPEVLGNAAIFCNPSRPAEFASAMEKIIKDEGLRNSLINFGRIQSQKFSWANSAQRLYNLIKTF